MSHFIWFWSLFVIGALANPINFNKNKVDSDVDENVFTWPAVKGVIYQMKIKGEIPVMNVRLADKSLDNNPDGDTVFMRSKSIKFNIKNQLEHMEYASLLAGHATKLTEQKPVYSFEDNILKMTIPDLGAIKVKVLSDASIQTTIIIDDDEGDLLESSFILSIMSSSDAEYYRNQGPEFAGRVMIENPEISLDLYESDTEDDIKIKFNAKDVIFDTADLENSFPFNVLQQFEETKKIPLTVIMAVSKY